MRIIESKSQLPDVTPGEAKVILRAISRGDQLECDTDGGDSLSPERGQSLTRYKRPDTGATAWAVECWQKEGPKWTRDFDDEGKAYRYYGDELDRRDI